MAKGLLLLSGGIDSPVAGKMVQQQKHIIDAIHFSYEPLVGTEATGKARSLAKKLGVKHFYIAPFGNALQKIVQKCDHSLYFVLSKRLMLHVASAFAKQTQHTFLVTGESIGQVSSQTLDNLAAIAKASSFPVARPLLGLDKQEVINLAQQYKTYETSVGTAEICDVLGPRYPETHAVLKIVEIEEKKLGVPALVKEIMAGLKTEKFLIKKKGDTKKKNLPKKGAPKKSVKKPALKKRVIKKKTRKRKK